ncbi:MAG: tetratricopeptide repeat protein [Anaerolineae bacterium]
MARLVLNYLGSFEVKLNEQEITHFRSTNVQGLLLYLSLQPDRQISRSVLAALFWPDEPEKSAKNNLRQSLFRLKKIFPTSDNEEPYFLVNRQSVQFNKHSIYECDLHQFDAALAAGNLAQAADLFKGNLADGFTADSLDFEEWLRLEREFVLKRGIKALHDLTGQQLAEGVFSAAQTNAQRQISFDPWSELGHRQLMLAHALSGDRSGALVQYTACREQLDEELGVEPSAETERLADAIREGESLDFAWSGIQSTGPKLDPLKVLGRLDPLPDQKLFGIEKKRDQVVEALEAADRPWLVSLDGLGGIGKTSLANEVVHHFIESDRFLDIGWVSAKQEEYVTGRGIQSTRKPALDAESLLDQLLAQLADGPYPANNFEAKRLALLGILREKPSLIVIDNLETIADYEALLPLLRFLSRPSKFLITSRMSLHNETDVLCHNLSELPEPDALAFLRYEAKHQDIKPLLDAPNGVLEEIYGTIGGNPLALKLAIGQANFLPVEQILHGLRLAKGKQNDDLYVYIYWQAWQMLDSDGRHLFVSLPMVPNGTLDQLAVASGLDGDRLQPAIEALRTLSLIEPGGGLITQRYRIHRLTETFLLHEVIRWQQPDMADREPESEQFEERLGEMLDHWQTKRNIVTVDVEALDAEKEGILRAISFGLDFEPSWPVVKELISALTAYMERWGHWSVWHQTLNRAIGVAQKLDDLDGALVMMNLRGRILQRLSRQDELIQNYRQVIRLARKTGNEIEEGRACSNLGFNLIDRGNYWRAEVLSCHALNIFDRLDYQHGQAHTHNHLGYLFTQVGRWEEAERRLMVACEIWKLVNDQSGSVRGLKNLGVLFVQQKMPTKAISYFNQSLEIVEQNNEKSEMPSIYLNLATCMNDLQNYSEAEKYARLAEKLFRQNNNFTGIYKAQIVLASSLSRQDQWQQAEIYFKASSEGFRSLKDRRLEMVVEVNKLKECLRYSKFNEAYQSIKTYQRLSTNTDNVDTKRDFEVLFNEYQQLTTVN